MGNHCVFAVFNWCPLMSEYFCLFYNTLFSTVFMTTYNMI